MAARRSGVRSAARDLVGAVIPIGLGLDRIPTFFGLVEAVAGLLFVVLMGKTLKE